MRSALPVVILLVIAVLLLPVITGCGKAKTTEESAVAPGGGTLPGATDAPAVQPPAANGPLGKLMGERAKLTSYKMTMTTPEGQTMTTFVKLKAGKQVLNKQIIGSNWVITDAEKNVMYMYDAERKTAMKMALGGAQGETKMPKPMAPDEMDLGGLEALKPNITDGEVDGVPCLVVQVVDAAGKGNRTWIDKQYGMARQIEMDGQMMKFNYEMINAVPDSEFQLPAGVKVQDMADMMKGAGGPPPAMPSP